MPQTALNPRPEIKQNCHAGPGRSAGRVHSSQQGLSWGRVRAPHIQNHCSYSDSAIGTCYYLACDRNNGHSRRRRRRRRRGGGGGRRRARHRCCDHGRSFRRGSRKLDLLYDEGRDFLCVCVCVCVRVCQRDYSEGAS